MSKEEIAGVAQTTKDLQNKENETVWTKITSRKLILLMFAMAVIGWVCHEYFKLSKEMVDATKGITSQALWAILGLGGIHTGLQTFLDRTK